MRIAVSEDGENLTASKIIPTPAEFNEGLQNIKKTSDELSKGEKITAVAGGIAGPLDKQKTILTKSPHLPNWVNKPLRQKLSEFFQTKVVFLENDVALGGLGEACFGAGKESSVLAYIAIGTGIGGVRIVNRSIDKNILGFEPGHQIIVPDGNACNCGGKGHLEAYVGGMYLQRIYQKKGEDITDPAVWDEVSRYLAIGLNNTIVHWSPGMIILGGSVAQSIPLQKLEMYVKEFLTIFSEVPAVKITALGDSAGFFGGLALLKQVQNSPL